MHGQQSFTSTFTANIEPNLLGTHTPYRSFTTQHCLVRRVANGRFCMTQLRTWIRQVLCFTSTRLKETQRQPESPSSQRQHLKDSISPECISAQTQQENYPHSNTLMPPKRKSQDTISDMDRLEKKSRRGMKDKGANHDVEKGKSIVLFSLLDTQSTHRPSPLGWRTGVL